MFCPRCGQQMAPDARFCSKCGFLLGGVSQLLVTNGVQGQTEVPQLPREPSQRQKGIQWGAKLLFLTAVLIPLVLGLSIAIDNPAPLLLPVTTALAGAALMLYARLFWPDYPKQTLNYPYIVQPPFVQNPQNPQNPMLAPPSAVPVNSYRAPRFNTADVQERPSVVEHTTKLLEHEPE